MTDEHQQDFDEIERLSREFTQKWESFFSGVWEEVKESTTENIENNIKKAWLEQDKKFYMEYVKNAYDLGKKRAESITEQVLQDDIFVPENNKNNIGIEKNDVYEELQKNSINRVSEMEKSTIQQVRKVLAEGYRDGEGWKELKNKIEKIVKNPARAEMIAITELGFAYNMSTKNTYRKAGANKVAWHASIDIRTCDTCRSLHGQEFDIDNAPDNPAHPRCRCTWLPVFSENGNFDNSQYNKYNIRYSSDEKWNKLKQKKQEYEIVLTEQEERAIKNYVSSEAYKINDALRNKGVLTQRQQEIVQNLDKALEKLPKYSGNLSRSLMFDNDELMEDFMSTLEVNRERTFFSYISTTKRGIYNPDGQVQIFIQNAQKGVDMGVHNAKEHEVLYARNSTFKVLNKTKKDGKYYILLEER